MTKANTTGPLQGIRILDLTSVVFGAYATQMLGDLGADIIKVESPRPSAGGGPGDITRWTGRSPEGSQPGLGALFMAFNRNKRSLLVDLTKPSGRRAIERLIAKSDVITSNIRHDALERLGLTYDAARRIKPDIIFVHGVGYGSDGPYAGQAAYDDLIQAGSGMADLQNRADGNPMPRYLPTAAADKVAGLFMVQAVTAALFHRQRTGEGQYVEVPMMECCTSFVLAEHFYEQIFDPPIGQWAYARMANPNRHPFRTRDGYVAIVPLSDAQWQQFFELAGASERLSGDPRFASYPQRLNHIRELYALVQEITQTRTTEEWLALLIPRSIPAARHNRLNDLPEDPHLKAVGFFQRLEHPAVGGYFTLRHPVRYAQTPATIRLHPPGLGQHTREILGEAGLETSEIDELS